MCLGLTPEDAITPRAQAGGARLWRDEWCGAPQPVENSCPRLLDVNSAVAPTLGVVVPQFTDGLCSRRCFVCQNLGIGKQFHWMRVLKGWLTVFSQASPQEPPLIWLLCAAGAAGLGSGSPRHRGAGGACGAAATSVFWLTCVSFLVFA